MFVYYFENLIHDMVCFLLSWKKASAILRAKFIKLRAERKFEWYKEFNFDIV
jgi:hypothetical protein